VQTLRRLFFKVARISLPAGVSGEASSTGKGFPGEAPDRPEKLLIKRSFNEQLLFFQRVCIVGSQTELKTDISQIIIINH
jgi:hypothetical protein